MMYLEVQSVASLVLYGICALTKVCEHASSWRRGPADTEKHWPQARKRLQQASTLAMPSEPLRNEPLLFTQSVAFHISVWTDDWHLGETLISIMGGPLTEAWVVLYTRFLSGSPTVNSHMLKKMKSSQLERERNLFGWTEGRFFFSSKLLTSLGTDSLNNPVILKKKEIFFFFVLSL